MDWTEPPTSRRSTASSSTTQSRGAGSRLSTLCRAIRRAVRDGWLPYIKPGKAYLFRMEDVRAAIEKRMEEQAKKDS